MIIRRGEEPTSFSILIENFGRRNIVIFRPRVDADGGAATKNLKVQQNSLKQRQGSKTREWSLV